MSEADAAGDPLPLRPHAPDGRGRRGLVVARPRRGVRRHRRGGRPHHAAARPGQGRLRRAARQRRGRCSSSRAAAEMTERFDEFAKLQPRRLGRRHGRGRADPARRALGQGGRVGAAGRGAAQLRRQVARRQRRRDALPPARGRPVGQRALAPAAADAQRRRAPHAPAPVGAGLRRGRDAVAAPHRRRRHGAPVRHAPQHVRHRLLPARGAGALPQAARGRRLRQGVRDRPQLPQRGHLAAPQPRVHDARALPGLRRLHRHHGRLRGAGGRPGARRARDDASSPTAGATSTSPRRGGAPP